MVFIIDDKRQSERLEFALNGKAAMVSEEDREKIKEAAAGILSVFSEELPGFSGVFVYRALDETPDSFCYQLKDSDKWFLVVSDQIMRLDAVTAKVILCDAVLCAVETGFEGENIDLVRIASKK